MRVLILGGGGLGAVLAGYLSRAGAEVTLLVRPAHAAAWDNPEVHISGLEEFTAPVQVATDAARLGEFDYLLVSVKAHDTEQALAPLRAARIGAALSLQNGVAKNDALVRAFGSERVLGGTSAVGGALQRPGHALHSLAGPTLVGELDGGTSERCERLAALVRLAGLPAACVPDIRTHEWHKLAIFLRTALVCALTRTDLASALLDPDLVRVCARVATEVAAVAEAEGASIWRRPVWITPSVSFARPEDEIVDDLVTGATILRAQGVPILPSLAQDTIAGRPTELDATAGDVLARAARHNIPTPTLFACHGLLRSILQRRGAEVRR